MRLGGAVALCAFLVTMSSAAVGGECPTDLKSKSEDAECARQRAAAMQAEALARARAVDAAQAKAQSDKAAATRAEDLIRADPASDANRGYSLASPKSAGPVIVSGIAVAASARRLIPVRAYLTAAGVPPPGIGAYGVVAFRAKPTTATRQRLLMVCEAFKAYLPPRQSLPASVGPGDQMLTIWPVDDPTAPGAKADSCAFAVDHYDLYGGISAIEDAERQGPKLGGEGPYLIGWSPSSSRGVPDKIVLVVDMSDFDSQDSFNRAFQFWQQKVVADPAFWRSGFSLEKTRLAIRDFLDRYGADLLGAVKIAGLTPK